MLRIAIVLLLLVTLIQAEINYIMALKSPATDETFKQVKKDVEAVGGKVNYEFKTAFKGVLVQLPNQEFTAFSSKSYVDFMEPDKSIHIA
ncbi:hypothetical protein BDF21DRAFT_464388 [Thamnidium elegans]|uniref:Inhibitor I9 domain-containing protein n=1 Tax=Thamnidium elegans TaxID=101142 RepID=A0A8H7STJ8_9FUNG|nr:hypothetical protein INT48_002331 [Thamnidium elegans]KAI8077211.1 hypothetical protein BDF21DRAFT_464388 [Thamnidium elegans]